MLSRGPGPKCGVEPGVCPHKSPGEEKGNRTKFSCEVKYTQLDTDQGLRNALWFGDTGVPKERGPPGWLCQGLRDRGALSSLLWARQVVKTPLRCPRVSCPVTSESPRSVQGSGALREEAGRPG